ncbi:MAG: preprotein translocase subunit SecY [Candidatus Cloacimonetes bacterium]|nr:preprotein translocase subunit SecY [Candidatus Cloacimonadota bacterium]
MFRILSNAWKIDELRTRLLFSMAMIAVFRLGCQIPTPGVDPLAMKELFANQAGVLGFLNMFSGGALERFSVFSLGIAPYINASIIMQLLVYVVPYLEKLHKEEGTEGRKKINMYTKYGTVVLGAIQAFGIAVWLESMGQIVLYPGMGFKLMAVITLTAGTAFIMWLGEQMTAKGIGNGMSLLITAGILATFPQAILETVAVTDFSRFSDLGRLVLIGIVCLAVVAAVVFMQDGVRKIPVQHTRRNAGMGQGGLKSFIPLKVNMAGVIPVIFASSVMMFPTLALQYAQNRFPETPWIETMNIYMGYTHPVHLTIYCLLVIFFTYFYTAIQLNPVEMAENLKKHGGFIPGIRAGKKTADFIDRLVTRITLCGALFLAAISMVPPLMTKFMNVTFYFGGTSLLIVVGVMLDTVRQMESHMVTRQYDGFLRNN